MSTSSSPRIPTALHDGDLVIGPDFVRVFHPGWVECGFSDCEWFLDGEATADRLAALREHTRTAHKSGR